MRYLKKLYVSEKLKGKEEKVIRSLEEGKFQFRVYLLVIPKRKENQLEVLHSGMFLQQWYAKEDVLVAGFAEGYDQALELVRQITEETVSQTGDAGIREYLLERQG